MRFLKIATILLFLPLTGCIDNYLNGGSLDGSPPAGCVDHNEQGAISCETGHSKQTWVAGYTRKDGTHVNGYWRS